MALAWVGYGWLCTPRWWQWFSNGLDAHVDDGAEIRVARDDLYEMYLEKIVNTEWHASSRSAGYHNNTLPEPARTCPRSALIAHSARWFGCVRLSLSKTVAFR